MFYFQDIFPQEFELPNGQKASIYFTVSKSCLFHCQVINLLFYGFFCLAILCLAILCFINLIYEIVELIFRKYYESGKEFGKECGKERGKGG